MSTLSVCTICQDEEEPIRWYLECCVRLYTDLGENLKEIVLVDGGSVDKTLDVIREYAERLPIKLLQRPFDCTRDQQNFGLDHCSGDFVFTPDADMTWTVNFGPMFARGMFDNQPFWNFILFFTVQDAYHRFNHSLGGNMRLHRRGPRWIRKFHVNLEGQTPGIPTFEDVIIFENSCRITSKEALFNRGERRQKCAAEMIAEGAGPGPADRFVQAAAARTDLIEVSEHVRSLILPSTNNT